jgi:ATP-dependent RNA helicase DeaD
LRLFGVFGVRTRVIENPAPASFRDLALSEPVLRALADVGYESPSPIQAATIPVLLSGADMLGQAQTGTGKTAAFALPALSRIDLSKHEPQVVVLVPTRELALQVSEAFLRYAAHIKGFHVLPIYGGQSYQPQLNALRRGVHVVVGTPGRVIDHMNRGTLKFTSLSLLVLDEADEMLQMGFLDAVESILEQTPPQRQVALFSATMAAPIRRIAAKHLRSPVEVTIKSKTSTAANIRQRYWMVSGMHKLDALTRILEAEPFDGMLVFTRTKQATVELAEKLEARGFAAAPLNGDIPQSQRERTVARLKSGQIDIVVATDVAARGLDVERIGHVVNYDVPYDTESYVHRVGRTGRAGRKGEAILFIAPRERNMLRAIERATRQVIEPMNLPTVDAVNVLRIAKFKQRIMETVSQSEVRLLRPVLENLEAETGVPLIEIAAALAVMAQGSAPLLLGGSADRGAGVPDRGVAGVLPDRNAAPAGRDRVRADRAAVGAQPARAPRLSGRNDLGKFPEVAARRSEPDRSAAREPARVIAPEAESSAGREPVISIAPEPGKSADRVPEISNANEPAMSASPGLARSIASGPGMSAAREPTVSSTPELGMSAAREPARSIAPKPERSAAREPPSRARAKTGRNPMETFRIEVGSIHGIKPSNVVGAIASEAGIEGVYIGRVDIREDHSFVDLPEGMPKQIFKSLQKVLVAGRELRITKVGEKSSRPHQAGPRDAVPGEAGPPTSSASRGARTIHARSPPAGGVRASQTTKVRTREAGARKAEVRPERKMLSRRPAPARSKRD